MPGVYCGDVRMRALGAIIAAGGPAPIDHSLFLPRVLPAGWARIATAIDGAAFKRTDGLAVVASASAELDSRRWLHVSCSRARRLPSWDDLAEAKSIFVGADRYAYSVLPPKSKYVNIHPFCLHLWSCLDAGVDGAVLPDFTQGGDAI